MWGFLRWFVPSRWYRRWYGRKVGNMITKAVTNPGKAVPLDKEAHKEMQAFCEDYVKAHKEGKKPTLKLVAEEKKEKKRWDF